MRHGRRLRLLQQFRREDREIYAARREEIETSVPGRQAREEAIDALDEWFRKGEPDGLREWREAMQALSRNPEAELIWDGFWELQGDRPAICVSMGPVLFGSIPMASKDAWLRRHRVRPGSEDDEFVRTLWKWMEGQLAEAESADLKKKSEEK